MYQTYWNTSDHVCISSLPQQKLLWCRVTSYRLGYSHNVSQSYNCLLKKKMFVKSSPVSALCQVQNLNHKMNPTSFVKVSPVIVSGDVFGEGSTPLWWLHETPLQNVPVSQDCYQIVTERKCATRRSRPWSKEADFFSISKLSRKNLENPFPSCRYRRSNGGWCLPTPSGRGAPGTTPGAPSGCGSRRWING